MRVRILSIFLVLLSLSALFTFSVFSVDELLNNVNVPVSYYTNISTPSGTRRFAFSSVDSGSVLFYSFSFGSSGPFEDYLNISYTSFRFFLDSVSTIYIPVITDKIGSYTFDTLSSYRDSDSDFDVVYTNFDCPLYYCDLDSSSSAAVLNGTYHVDSVSVSFFCFRDVPSGNYLVRLQRTRASGSYIFPFLNVTGVYIYSSELPLPTNGLLSMLGGVVTAVLGWVTEAVITITSNSFILVTCGVFMLGAAIGILRRLLFRR